MRPRRSCAVLVGLVVCAGLAVTGCGDADGGSIAAFFGEDTVTPPSVATPEPTGGITPPIAGQTATVTAATTPLSTQDPTVPASVTATPRQPGDEVAVVACGDPLAVLDKEHRLPADCVPSGLVPIPEGYYWQAGELTAAANAAMVVMLDAALAEGHDLYATSAYRSYATQESTYNWHVATYGEVEADRVSARPGHSEHQLGTTVDITNADVGFELVKAFGETAGGRWLAENAADFGFALSYPDGFEAITGYDYEPWHFRYIGPSLATEFEASGLTLREFLLAR